MKKYVFITPAVGGMGGAQMYLANKLSFMERNGWDTHVFYTVKYDDVLIKSLDKYVINYIPEIRYPVYYIPTKVLNNAIGRVYDDVNPKDNDKIIVETHLITTAYFGELLAKALHGRHILNYLEEQIRPFPRTEIAYFDYKIKRWEIMNASTKRLKKVFGDSYNEGYTKYVNVVKYMCANVVDKDSPISMSIDKSDFNIISIGRLDKPYIYPMSVEIKLFANKFPLKKMNVFYVGGSDDGKMEKLIPSIFDECDNLKPYIFGYTYPIPEDLIKISDVAIACASSVFVTADYGIPTICVDINDFQSIGLFNITTQQRFSRMNEEVIPISDMLKDVLINRKYDHYPRVENPINEMDIEFENQLAFLGKSENNTGYYDVMSMFSPLKRLISSLKWYLRKITDKL